jgi:hypothetical protein
MNTQKVVLPYGDAFTILLNPSTKSGISAHRLDAVPLGGLAVDMGAQGRLLLFCIKKVLSCIFIGAVPLTNTTTDIFSDQLIYTANYCAQSAPFSDTFRYHYASTPDTVTVDISVQQRDDISFDTFLFIPADLTASTLGGQYSMATYNLGPVRQDQIRFAELECGIASTYKFSSFTLF